MSNPLESLIILNLKPCNCGGLYGQMKVSKKWVCVPAKPIYRQVKKKVIESNYAGMSYALFREIESLSMQNSNLGVLAKAILVIGRKTTPSKLKES